MTELSQKEISLITRLSEAENEIERLRAALKLAKLIIDKNNTPRSEAADDIINSALLNSHRTVTSCNVRDR